MPAILGLLLAATLVFVSCLLGATIGAFAGWCVGLVFDDSMVLLAKALGIPTAAPYQLGAILGFVSGFFRMSVSKSKE